MTVSAAQSDDAPRRWPASSSQRLLKRSPKGSDRPNPVNQPKTTAVVCRNSGTEHRGRLASTENVTDDAAVHRLFAKSRGGGRREVENRVSGCTHREE